ncbi:unnamed protein product, partial [Sphenostylis stenocarpa]
MNLHRACEPVELNHYGEGKKHAQYVEIAECKSVEILEIKEFQQLDKQRLENDVSLKVNEPWLQTPNK